MTHLTDDELRSFLSGEPPEGSLWRLDEHLSQCQVCRGRAEQLGGTSRALDMIEVQLQEPSAHLSEEDVVALVRNELPPGERANAAEHLASCATCARQVNDLREWAEAGAPAERRRESERFASTRMLALAAAIALAAIVIPSWVWYTRSASSNASQAAVAATLPGLDTLDPVSKARVAAALDSGAATPPQTLDDLRGAREVLLGPTSRAGSFELTTPVGTFTLAERPTFEWQPLSSADEYVVSVFDEQSHVIVQSEGVRSTAWTPAQSLPRDVTLVWQVAAKTGAGSVTAPVAPAPPARFRIVDAATAQRLRAVESQHPGSHLLLGLLYADAGIVDQATAQLRQVSETDPKSGVARETLRRLNAGDTVR